MSLQMKMLRTKCTVHVVCVGMKHDICTHFKVLCDCVPWPVVREGVTPDAAEQSDSVQGPVHRKDRLIQEKRLVEVNSAHILSGKVFTKSVRV